MTPGTFALLSLAGGAGAALRYAVDALVRARTTSPFPWPTTLINLPGCLVLGFITGLVAGRFAGTELSLVLGTGFLGGYTTFSTASYETVDLVRRGHDRTALLYGVGVLVGGVALAAAGYLGGMRV
ncbi:fluoride efflux transporter CrcB [Cellulomonas hominis]|uniref:Fluoride-specific ion channel FluC n=1 Tax=Cellulomonas hominis TaxID=156981 RepID=A0A7Z8JYN0_9CELL|nr:fluoride efflux transporter CrcB [Cellulomonas hominis]TKR23559.1 fluoride efflux transporter CrcB [Cellulomonas hominis]